MNKPRIDPHFYFSGVQCLFSISFGQPQAAGRIKQVGKRFAEVVELLSKLGRPQQDELQSRVAEMFNRWFAIVRRDFQMGNRKAVEGVGERLMPGLRIGV